MRWLLAKVPAWIGLLAVVLGPQHARAQMAVHGSFDVTDSGSAQYSIEIPAPPGITALQPHLSLVYSSGAGNGLLGMGWSLAGLSSISRCPRTWAQDGLTATGAAPGGIHFDTQNNTDAYCLDGQRLLPVPATGSQGVTEFRTEIDNLSRIIAFGANPSNPDYFQVESKSGLVSVYGTTTDSRVEIASGSTTWRQWALSAIKDRFGHQITASYFKNMAVGDFRPSSLNYSWLSDGVSTGASVIFSYIGRSDVTQSYVWGSMLSNNYLLSEIQTTLQVSGGTRPVTDYHMYYAASGPAGEPASSQTSLLDHIQVCAQSPAGPGAQPLAAPDCSTMPAVTFTYNTGAAPGESVPGFTQTQSGNQILATDQIYPGDYFGDGVDGLFVAASATCSFLWGAPYCWNGWKLFRNTTSGMLLVASDNSPYAPGGPINSSFVVADFQGTGRPGVFAVTPGGYDSGGYGIPNAYILFAPNSPSASPGLSVVAQGSIGSGSESDHYFAGDFLGTGQMTLLQTAQTGWTMYAYDPSTGSLQTIGMSPQTSGLLSDPSNGPTAADRVLVATFSGDGTSQVLTVCDPCTYPVTVTEGGSVPQGNPYAGWRLYSFDGTNMNLVSSGYASAGNGPDRYNDIYPGNFGGDGKASLFVVPHFSNMQNQNPSWDGWSLWRSTGNSFQYLNGGPTIGGERFFVGDFNGDGRDGVLVLGDASNQASPVTGWRLWASDGSQMVQVAFGNFPSTTESVVVGSYSHHAGASLIVTTPSSPSSGWALYDTNWQQFLYLLTSVNNGQTTTSVTYQPLNAPGVHTPATADAYPINDINPSMPVVTAFSVDDGLGGQLNNVYAYAGSKADRTGRGLLGFTAVASNQAQSDMSVVKTFAQNFPYTGFVLSLNGYFGNQQLSHITNNPGCQDFVTPNMGCSVTPGHRYFVYKQSTIAERWDLNGAAFPNQMVVSTYGDGWGNETQTVTTTNDGYSDTVNRQFSNDPTDWLLGRQTQSSETRASP